nr:MAG TPA: hypothetical protein [Caudoviricetes sp.]
MFQFPMSYVLLSPFLFFIFFSIHFFIFFRKKTLKNKIYLKILQIVF